MNWKWDEATKSSKHKVSDLNLILQHTKTCVQCTSLCDCDMNYWRSPEWLAAFVIFLQFFFRNRLFSSLGSMIQSKHVLRQNSSGEPLHKNLPMQVQFIFCRAVDEICWVERRRRQPEHNDALLLQLNLQFVAQPWREITICTPHAFWERTTPTPPVANGILQPNFIRVSWIAPGCNNTDGFCRLVIYHYNVANFERHTVYLNYLVISHPPSTLDCQCHAKYSGRISPVFKRRVCCNYWKSLLHNASVFW